VAIQNLSDDAKTILLLCGHFGKMAGRESEKPLTLVEYNRLVDWMVVHRIRPADLLTESGKRLAEAFPPGIDGDRLKSLLSRGGSMALFVEKWSHSGVWFVCRSDTHYPQRLKDHLKKQAPPVLYGIGDIGLLRRGGLAIVGSRNIDSEGEIFTKKIAREIAGQGVQVVSGGAWGVDRIAMLEALNSGGTVVGVLADSLLKSALTRPYRNGILNNRMTLISTCHPDARFNVENALKRNKTIYALADLALIISAETGQGGTWAGARAELGRVVSRPLFVRDEKSAPAGNRELIQLGAKPFPNPPWDSDLMSQLN